MNKEEKADAIIGEFDAWFQTLPNEPLVKSEKAVLKAMLYWADRNSSNLLLSEVVVTLEVNDK
jgi:hypothetical protein